VASPRYARFYEALAALARPGKRTAGGTDTLARLAHVRRSKVWPMLEGAKALGFVTKRPRKRNYFEVEPLPPIGTLSDKKVRALARLGVPLSHGNRRQLEEALMLYARWCTVFERRRNRAYVPESLDEVRRLRNLVRLSAWEWPSRIEPIMEMFIRRRRALKLNDHRKFREHGVTVKTFCSLYSPIARKYHEQRFSPSDFGY